MIHVKSMVTNKNKTRVQSNARGTPLAESVYTVTLVHICGSNTINLTQKKRQMFKFKHYKPDIAKVDLRLVL